MVALLAGGYHDEQLIALKSWCTQLADHPEGWRQRKKFLRERGTNNKYLMEMLLEDITIFTITGIKHIYKLGDMAYGQWLIFKNGLPIYYLDIFDEMYENIDETIKKDLCRYLEKKFIKDNEHFSLSQKIKGIWSPRVANKLFDIEKLPVNFFIDL